VTGAAVVRRMASLPYAGALGLFWLLLNELPPRHPAA
jgi:hypothetical protein